LQNFRVQLKGFYVEGRSTNGFPSVSYFAEKANLSPGYFGELIKKETGKTPQELIGNHILECARQRLVLSKDFVSTIAYDLGFTHPQHFTRFFKQRTGMTPKEFRQSAIRKDKWVR
jgi:transcriptional regulator, araC family